jgi:hypothetical protein
MASGPCDQGPGLNNPRVRSEVACNVFVLTVGLPLLAFWVVMTPLAALGQWICAYDRPTLREAVKAWWGECPPFRDS